MNCLTRLALLLSIALVLPQFPARAETPPDLRLNLQLDYASKYLWRGLVYNDDAVVKPRLSLGYGGAELSILGIFDSNDYWGREDNFEEVDYELSYRHALTEQVTLKGGVLYYYYPGQSAPADASVFLRATLERFLRPELTVYYDFRGSDGFYATLGASHEVALPAVHDKLSLILDALVGWGSSNWNDYTFPIKLDDSAFVNFSPGATLQYTASEHLSLAWYLRYDYLLDSEIRDHAQAFGIDSSNLHFGARVSYTF